MQAVAAGKQRGLNPRVSATDCVRGGLRVLMFLCLLFPGPWPEVGAQTPDPAPPRILIGDTMQGIGLVAQLDAAGNLLG